MDVIEFFMKIREEK